MRALRIYYQVFFLSLWVLFFWLCAQERLRGYPVTWFLDSSALNALGALLASWNVAHWMWLGFLLLALTALVGRVFCGWLCPLGTVLHLASWLAEPRATATRIARNRWLPLQNIKYLLTVGLLAAAVLGVLQVGLFDPIALFARVTTVFFAPLATDANSFLRAGTLHRSFQGAVWWAVLFVAMLALNAWRPRFWCRYVCPLGALLGFASRWVLGAVTRDPQRCTTCGTCEAVCPAACSPSTLVKTHECFVCWNCIERCPERALSWQWIYARRGKSCAHVTNGRQTVPAGAVLSEPIRPGSETSVQQHRSFAGGYQDRLIPPATGPSLPRRRLLAAALAGVAWAVGVRLAGTTRPRGFPLRIRPPGALPENEFLARCLKCGLCMKICPTNVLQPALTEAGVEGFLTPILNMRIGYCELNCTLCGQVCPSGAIQRLTIAQKLGHPHGQPIKIGTAFFDRGRCLPWAMQRNCVVCQEVCPVSPKAIYTLDEQIVVRDGKRIVLHRPYVDPAQCIGCGLCQRECPVEDLPAIRVSAVGESRAGGSFYLSGET
ncbi:MAG: 4Fe-4S dicluster domain-containing protein [bacterium]|nr:4Fe-4S dicluster domain-containing protein [bacterium]